MTYPGMVRCEDCNNVVRSDTMMQGKHRCTARVPCPECGEGVLRSELESGEHSCDADQARAYKTRTLLGAFLRDLEKVEDCVEDEVLMRFERFYLEWSKTKALR